MAKRYDVNANDDNQTRGDRGSRVSVAEERQKREFGGIHWGSAMFGWLVVNAVAVLLIGLLSALGGAVALQVTDSTRELTNQAPTVGLVSAILILLAMAIAYFAGGYVAGRMSRFEGAKQGLAVWILGIIAAILFALAGGILGSSFNLLQQANLPTIPTGGQDLTTVGLITLLISLVVTLIAATTGGKVGERYHHKVDNAARV